MGQKGLNSKWEKSDAIIWLLKGCTILRISLMKTVCLYSLIAMSLAWA